MDLVRVRLAADTPDDLERAVVALMAALGDRVEFRQPARWGRHGDWLIYGMLETAHGVIDASSDTGGVGGGWIR